MIRKRAGRLASVTGTSTRELLVGDDRLQRFALPERLDTFYADLAADDVWSSIRSFTRDSAPTRSHVGASPPLPHLAHNGEESTRCAGTNPGWRARSDAREATCRRDTCPSSSPSSSRMAATRRRSTTSSTSSWPEAIRSARDDDARPEAWSPTRHGCGSVPSTSTRRPRRAVGWPAALLFTDGVQSGRCSTATAPAREFIVTHDGLSFARASSSGRCQPEQIARRGVSPPAKMLLVDNASGANRSGRGSMTERRLARPVRGVRSWRTR